MILTLALSVFLVAPQAQNLFGVKPPSEKEMTTLEGNSIPEWNNWAFAFLAINTGFARNNNLPSEFYDLNLGTTEQQRQMIASAAAESKKNDDAYDVQRMKILEKLVAIKIECSQFEIQKRQSCFDDKGGKEAATSFAEYELNYRQRTLDIRDRLLRRLEDSPLVQNALINWVRAVTAGRTIKIVKSELTRFLQPR